METSRLEIRRFHARYLVPREHSAPERIRARLDEAVTRSLADTLSSILSRCFLDTDPTVWLMRRLDVEIDVNSAWDKEPLSRAWARELGTNLYATLQDGADGDNVLRFPNRAAYLSRFLVDVAAGRAWTKWCYESFSGLRLLPASGVLRTAVCERPETGLAALHQLAVHELEEILRALTAQDACAILDAVAAGGAATDASLCFQAAREAWERMEIISITTEEQWRNALHLYLDASRDRTDVGGPYLKAAAVELSRALPATITSRAANSGEQASPRHTSFGGLFLLLPLIDELPLAEATRDWPDSEEADAVALVRFLLLVKCCGRSRAAKAIYDPLLRDLMGIAPSISPSVLGPWQKKISVSNRKAFLKILADWHDERGAATVEVFGDRDKLRKDLAYLSLPKTVGLSPTFDFTLSVAAQSLMRAFSWGLPGFAGSNLPYLYSNFLECSAAIEEEPERRVVRLSRPPLYLVLNLTGACNKTYQLSWLDERPFALFPES